MENQPIKWHQSLAFVAALLLVVVLVTAPCWGAALILAAVR